MRLDKSFNHCIEQSKSQKIYTIIYWNQYKDDIHIYDVRYSWIQRTTNFLMHTDYEELWKSHFTWKNVQSRTNIFKIWWTAEALKLLLNSKEIMSSENAPHLDVIEVVLVYCNIVNNWNQCNSWVLSTVVPNKPFGELLIFH